MASYPKLSAIVAKSRNNVIGRDGGLPWHLSSDLKFFKKTTLGKPVLMGRTTWEGLPFPLPGRPNLVLTRNRDYFSPDAEICHSVKGLIGRGFEIAGATGGKEVMIIGGAMLYKTVLPFCDRLYISDVRADISGDVFFPEIDSQYWKLRSEKKITAGAKDDFDFTIKVLDRI